MWFIIIYIVGHTDVARKLDSDINGQRYATQAECLDSARTRADALKRIGMHGGYLCMYHREPDRELAHAPKWSF